MAAATPLSTLSSHHPSPGGGILHRVRSTVSTQTHPPETTVDLYSSHSPRPIPNLPTHQLHRIRSFLKLAGKQRNHALGQSLHAAIIKAHPHHDDTRLFNSLISAYLNLGLLPDARKVFDEMPSPDIASFTSIIFFYAKSGMETEAFSFLTRMRLIDIHPNEHTFTALATNCIRQQNLQLGSQVHALAVKTNHTSSTHVSNALMGIYAKCGKVQYALQLFDEMPDRDISSWNAAILGMVEDSRLAEAFKLFHCLSTNGKFGDSFSLSTLLNAATKSFTGTEGETIHAYAVKTGLDTDLIVSNSLLAFYAKFEFTEPLMCVFNTMPVRDVISWTIMVRGFMGVGQVESALALFYQMPERNPISYNALLAGLCKNGLGSKCLDFFHHMLEDRVEISDFTLSSLVTASALTADRSNCEQIHGFIIKSGCKFGALMDASLIDMYAKCGKMEDAHKIYQERSYEETRFTTWTSLVHAYSRDGQPEEALHLFHKLIEADKFAIIDEVTLATVLGVCGSLGFVTFGSQIHSSAIKLGVSEVGVSNAILSMYAKCGYLNEAVRFFDQMSEHDIVSWNMLINTYLLFRQGDEALSTWNQMEKHGVKPDSISYVLIISACKYTSSNSVCTCQSLFRSMLSSQNIEPKQAHYAAMVDVLSSRGCFQEVEALISTMPFVPDASVWRSLLDACRLKSDQKHGLEAMQRLLALEPRDPATHTLIANLYSASGRWHCSEKARKEMRARGMRKNPARSWVSMRNSVHSFFGRDKLHPQCRDIYGALEVLILECMKAGYKPDTSFVLQEVEEYQKREFLFYHSAKLAATYGIIMSKQTETVRAGKNVRLCGDCHEFLKLASLVTCRDVLFRDPTGFHFFKGGDCSCRGCW